MNDDDDIPPAPVTTHFQIVRHPEAKVWVLFMETSMEALVLGKSKHGKDGKERFAFAGVRAVRANGGGRLLLLLLLLLLSLRPLRPLRPPSVRWESTLKLAN